MAIRFNPLTGNFDFTGSGGGGGSSYIDGEVQNFSALPETLGTPAVDSAYLVRAAEGTWLLARKPAGIYIRTANTGVRADDWTHAGAFPDVFNDANFLLYDNGDSSKNLAFQLSGISASTTRTLTAPNASGTIALTSQLVDTKIYTANDTWNKPAGARLVHYLIISGGGGGGSGRVSDSSTAAGGGNGGGGGGVIVGWADASYFSSAETIVVGAGGAGGVARTTNNANGLIGAAGGASSFGNIAGAGGAGGAAGTTADNATTAGITNAILYYSALTNSSAGTRSLVAANGPAGVESTAGPAGGGGGGSKSSAGVYFLGGDGGPVGSVQNRTGRTLGGVAVAGAVGGNGVLSHASFFGTGAAGGSADSSTGDARAGGTGGLYGGGGGGGSGSLNGTPSGAGGAGGAGVVIITTYF